MLDHEPDTNTQPTTNTADPVDAPPPAGGDGSRTGGWPARRHRGGSVIETVSSTRSTPRRSRQAQGSPEKVLQRSRLTCQPQVSRPHGRPPRGPARPRQPRSSQERARTVAEPADRAGDRPRPRRASGLRKRPLRRLRTRRLRPSWPLRASGRPARRRPPDTAVNSEDEPATVDVQASPAAELEPSGESIGVVDAEQAQPTAPKRWFRPATSSPLDDLLKASRKVWKRPLRKRSLRNGRRGRRRRAGPPPSPAAWWEAPSTWR